jgi:hypothetical protein
VSWHHPENALPTAGRLDSPAVDIGTVDGEKALTGLRTALAALPEERLRPGVRARLAPGLRCEDAFRALIAIAAAGAGRIDVESRGETRAPGRGIRIDGRPVEERARQGPETGETVPRLVLR